MINISQHFNKRQNLNRFQDACIHITGLTGKQVPGTFLDAKKILSLGLLYLYLKMYGSRL
jgi:hypothetical protein